MKKAALLLIILTIFSKFIGLAREITLSYFYGASYISDAYIIALTIPTVLFAIIGQAITTGYIPLYNKVLKHKGINGASNYTNNLINILLVICTIIITISLIFIDEIVFIFASGFEEETFNLAKNLVRVSIFTIYFTVLLAIFQSLLQIYGNFSATGLIGLPLNVVLITTIILSSYKSIEILSFGIVMSSVCQLLFLFPFIKKTDYKYKFIFKPKDPYIREMLLLALPVIIGVAVNDINNIIDRTLASQIQTGGISALNYANQLNRSVVGIVIISITTAMYPMLSKLAVNKNISELKKVVSEALIIVSILVVPAAIGIMTLSKPIVEFVFGRGNFDSEAVLLTSNALFYYSIGILGYGLREVLSRPFYAIQDIKTPVINTAIGVCINIILNIILSRYLGIGGLALATSIAATITGILMYISFKKRIGSFLNKDFLITYLKVIIASLLMGFVIKIIYIFLYSLSSLAIAIVTSVLAGIFTYILLIILMKVKEVEVAFNILVEKLRANK